MWKVCSLTVSKLIIVENIVLFFVFFFDNKELHIANCDFIVVHFTWILLRDNDLNHGMGKTELKHCVQNLLLKNCRHMPLWSIIQLGVPLLNFWLCFYHLLWFFWCSVRISIKRYSGALWRLMDCISGWEGKGEDGGLQGLNEPNAN